MYKQYLIESVVDMELCDNLTQHRHNCSTSPLTSMSSAFWVPGVGHTASCLSSTQKPIGLSLTPQWQQLPLFSDHSFLYSDWKALPRWSKTGFHAFVSSLVFEPFSLTNWVSTDGKLGPCAGGGHGSENQDAWWGRGDGEEQSFPIFS